MKYNNNIKNLQTRLFRGRRSRNKVSVGEPAEGSLSIISMELSCVLLSVFFFFYVIQWMIEDKKWM